jgi:hypothetical protein
MMHLRYEGSLRPVMKRDVSNYYCLLIKQTDMSIFYLSIHVWLYNPLLDRPGPLFSFLIFYTVGRTPWTGDQQDRYLFTQDSTNTE